jgi:hypothetical protein
MSKKWKQQQLNRILSHLLTFYSYLAFIYCHIAKKIVCMEHEIPMNAWNSLSVFLNIHFSAENVFRYRIVLWPTSGKIGTLPPPGMMGLMTQ